MTRVASIWGFGFVTILLLVAAMSAWRFAPELAVRHATEAYAATWGIRSVAIALALAAQVLLLTCVVGRIYPSGLPDKLLSASLGLASVAALVAAVALGWSSR